MTEQETQTQETPKTIPYERFQEVVREKNELKTRLDEAVSKMTSTEKEREDFKSKYEKSQRELDIERVAAKYQLPAELAARLQGNTPEELAKDAEALSKLVVKQNPGLPDVPRGADSKPKTEMDLVDEFITNSRPK